MVVVIPVALDLVHLFAELNALIRAQDLAQQPVQVVVQVALLSVTKCAQLVVLWVAVVTVILLALVAVIIHAKEELTSKIII
jgi:hypothetical protein